MALTGKQEKFAQGVASGLNQSAAYRLAYDAEGMKPTSINVNSCQLMSEAKVAQRVAELRAPIVEKLRYGLEAAMKEAEEALEVSREERNGGAMVSAITLRAKLAGLLIDRKVIRTGPLDSATPEDLDAFQAALEAVSRARLRVSAAAADDPVMLPSEPGA